ncbi:helicase SNF2 family protein [Caballeronia glebae]|uniref:Helicase SNF2 family protein n=2 Tax=Caballeronia glebae TaxID=1777143 RepID=A0A158D048_9BURK|nr:helicase SNF2 family protein [Caballeronia glebae]
MGKTIEAGIVIRQFLLTNSEGRVWVIAPPSLVRQWETELEDKLAILDFPERINVCSIDKMATIPTDGISMLVVDEAHHLVADEIPHELTRLASSSPRLLLLSATPPLGQPEVLLRLLKVLDPDNYGDVGLEEFSTRVREREALGIFLRGLRPDASPAILRQRLRRLPDLFPSDREAMRMGEQINSALQENAQEALQRHVSDLRSHIADVYRIHHRLIRTRRRDAADWVFRPRGPASLHEGEPNLEHVRLSWIEDSRLTSVFELFEQWRVELASKFPKSSAARTEASQAVVTLFEALGCSVDVFAEILDALPGALFDEAWRSAFTSVIQEQNDKPSRPLQVAAVIKRHLEILQQQDKEGTPRIAVFGSNADDLEKCYAALQTTLGKERVWTAPAHGDDDGDIAAEFESDKQARVLVCNRQQEEGLNLHFVDALVHLDLPFSPARIEQRIGRLDRFGRRKRRLEQRVFFPSVNEESSLWEAWFDVLAKAFDIFNSPIADVQFSLAEISAYLTDALFEHGALGLHEVIPHVREQLAAERERLDNQYALDRVQQEEDAAEGLFRNLDELEGEESFMSTALRGWLLTGLGFSCKGDYERIFRVTWDAERTLLPLKPWGPRFQGALAESHTFHRSYALRQNEHGRPQLIRVGSKLMRAVEQEYRWDDRGTAFGTWRHLLSDGEEEWFAFKLCYIVEASLPTDLTADEKSGLRARMDGYFQPWAEELYIDEALEVVEDEERIRLLALPYDSLETHGRDHNLGSRQECLFTLIEPSRFEQLCDAVRNSSEAWLRERPRFKLALEQSVARGQADIDRRNRRLFQRQLNQRQANERVDVGLARELELNALLSEALRNPVVTLDAIGIIVLSGRAPAAFMEGRT